LKPTTRSLVNFMMGPAGKTLGFGQTKKRVHGFRRHPF
jgi:hypothetical protein